LITVDRALREGKAQVDCGVKRQNCRHKNWKRKGLKEMALNKEKERQTER
jgi:hypothetical protein